MTKNLMHYLFLMATGLFLHACRPTSGLYSVSTGEKIVGYQKKDPVVIGKTNIRQLSTTPLPNRELYYIGTDKKIFLKSSAEIRADTLITLWADITSGRIIGATVRGGNRFMTEKKIRIGDPVQALEKAHGRPRDTVVLGLQQGERNIGGIPMYLYGDMRFLILAQRVAQIELGQTY
ncbi:MAG: hypothetical protein J0L99_12825 [Chitinophagales bacterium]|nr:hypothetical protein [Chitinophagales bacterium]